MIVYLAGRYSRHPEMREYRDRLEANGHKVVAEWIEGEHEMYEGADEEELNAQFAAQDMRDLGKCSALVLIGEGPDDPKGRGGRMVELGMALAYQKMRAKMKTIIVVGHRENVFTYLPGVHFTETFEEAMDLL